MSELEIVDLGATRVQGGNALWQGTNKVSEDDGDNEPMGEGPVFQGLGLSSCAWPADANGKAEGICVRSASGRNTVYVGARDTRSAAIVGNMKPGDTVVHSTGPQQAAQLQLKEEKRQAALVSKNAAGKTMVVTIDGDGNKVQIQIPGMIFEMNANDKSITLSNGDAKILMQGDTIALDGNVILGGTTPNPALKFMIAPGLAPVPTPIATTAAGHPVAAAKSVSPAV
jgi:hypothetical protein